MEKLKVQFTVNAADDGKANVLCISSITTEDGICYKVPKEIQKAELHTCITSTSVYTNIKNTLKKRNQKRNVYIKITEDMKQAYWDFDGNVIIGGQYPEEIIGDQHDESHVTEKSITDQVVKAFELMIHNQKSSERPNLRILSEKFVLEKFNGKGNVHEWLNSFEKECSRWDIRKEEEKIEIFRVFLEKSCLDWYRAMMLKHNLQSSWEIWRDSFKASYANKGWQNSRYALSFKYQTGSLLEYAVKKERLLLEARNTTDQGMLIDIIVAGLPDYIAEKIDREEMLETKYLFNELGKLEHLVTKQKSKKDGVIKTYFKEKTDGKKPCSICKDLKNKSLYHSESSCWFKSKNEPAQRKYSGMKNINNSVIEAEIHSYSKN